MANPYVDCFATFLIKISSGFISSRSCFNLSRAFLLRGFNTLSKTLKGCANNCACCQPTHLLIQAQNVKRIKPEFPVLSSARCLRKPTLGSSTRHSIVAASNKWVTHNFLFNISKTILKSLSWEKSTLCWSPLCLIFNCFSFYSSMG